MGWERGGGAHPPAVLSALAWLRPLVLSTLLLRLWPTLALPTEPADEVDGRVGVAASRALWLLEEGWGLGVERPGGSVGTTGGGRAGAWTAGKGGVP